MRTRNLAGTAAPVDVALKPTTGRRQTTRNTTEAKETVLKSKDENTPAKTRSTRSRGSSKPVGKENATSKGTDAGQVGSRKRTRGGKASEPLAEVKESPEVVQPPVAKKAKVAQGKSNDEVAVEPAPVPTSRTSNRKKAAKEEDLKGSTEKESRPVEDQVNPLVTEPVVKKRGRLAKASTKGVDNAKDNNKIIEKEREEEGKVEEVKTKRGRATGRRKEPEGGAIDQPVVKEGIKEPVKEIPKEASPSPIKPLNPVSSLQSKAIATSTPTLSKPLPKETPLQPIPVPVNKSPVYLTKPAVKPPPIPKPVPVDDGFGLMPLVERKRTKKATTKAPSKTTNPPRTLPVSIVEDDVYGMDFNDPQEPQPKKKATANRRPRAAAKPKAKKATEPTGLRLWDEKALNQKQRQIKINVLHKDFKPKEKPIPLPPQRPQMPLNSTAKNASSVPSQIQISDIHIEGSVSGHPNRNAVNTSSANGSRLMPWRYSTIRNVSMGNVTMSSLNDSNAENVNPRANSGPATNSRPLHTLQLQRSPMKELNPNQTIPVPRPQKSPAKKVFDVENNFGFEDSDEEVDQEPLEAKRNKINDKIDSLKKFRHSLSASHASSPIVGPMRVKPPQPKQLTTIRNQLFTSTPQQVKIRDAFRASTPLAGSSKQREAAEKERQAEGGLEELKLFESLTFEAPAKRNYSSIVPRRKKKVDFYGFSDDDASEDEMNKSQEESLEPPRAKQAKKSKVQQVHEEKLAKFVDEFNSMCEEVDQYELVIE